MKTNLNPSAGSSNSFWMLCDKFGMCLWWRISIMIQPGWFQFPMFQYFVRSVHLFQPILYILIFQPILYISCPASAALPMKANLDINEHIRLLGWIIYLSHSLAPLLKIIFSLLVRHVPLNTYLSPPWPWTLLSFSNWAKYQATAFIQP